jgi:hypothetical protein
VGEGRRKVKDTLFEKGEEGEENGNILEGVNF